MAPQQMGIEGQQPASLLESGARPEVRTGVSVASVWRDALVTFGAHSAPILVCAFSGFALASILAAILSGVLTLDMYWHSGTILASYGLNRSLPLAIEAVVGLFMGVFARGAITWLALRRPGLGEARSAARATLARGPLLLLAWVITGGLLFAGNSGITSLLRELQIDLGNAAQLSFGLDGMAHSILLRILNGWIPDPGPPFTQALIYISTEISRVSASLVYAGGLSYYRVVAIQEIPVPLLVGSGSLLLLIGGDTLVRFIPAGLMHEPQGNGLRSMLNAVRLSASHFWTVMAHTWLVRLAVFIMSSMFVTAPLVLVQSVLVPLMISSTGSAWLYVVATVLVSVSLSLVNMVFVAFAVVYDACLYRRMSRDWS